MANLLDSLERLFDLLSLGVALVALHGEVGRLPAEGIHQ